MCKMINSECHFVTVVGEYPLFHIDAGIIHKHIKPGEIVF